MDFCKALMLIFKSRVFKQITTIHTLHLLQALLGLAKKMAVLSKSHPLKILRKVTAELSLINLIMVLFQSELQDIGSNSTPRVSSTIATVISIMLLS